MYNRAPPPPPGRLPVPYAFPPPLPAAGPINQNSPAHFHLLPGQLYPPPRLPPLSSMQMQAYPLRFPSTQYPSRPFLPELPPSLPPQSQQAQPLLYRMPTLPSVPDSGHSPVVDMPQPSLPPPPSPPPPPPSSPPPFSPPLPPSRKHSGVKILGKDNPVAPSIHLSGEVIHHPDCQPLLGERELDSNEAVPSTSISDVDMDVDENSPLPVGGNFDASDEPTGEGPSSGNIVDKPIGSCTALQSTVEKQNGDNFVCLRQREGLDEARKKTLEATNTHAQNQRSFFLIQGYVSSDGGDEESRDSAHEQLLHLSNDERVCSPSQNIAASGSAECLRLQQDEKMVNDVLIHPLQDKRKMNFSMSVSCKKDGNPNSSMNMGKTMWNEFEHHESDKFSSLSFSPRESRRRSHSPSGDNRSPSRFLHTSKHAQYQDQENTVLGKKASFVSFTGLPLLSLDCFTRAESLMLHEPSCGLQPSLGSSIAGTNIYLPMKGCSSGLTNSISSFPSSLHSGLSSSFTTRYNPFASTFERTFPSMAGELPTGYQASGSLYDPLCDSIDPSEAAFRKLNSGAKLIGQCDDGADMAGSDDEVCEGPVDAGAGVVENASPEPSNGVAGELVADQRNTSERSKRNKSSKSLKLFKIAISEFVKAVLKPSWRQGNMSKEAFKTIVKKTVDKVSGSLPSNRVPRTQEKIDQYIETSQTKLTKLVMGYVDKCVKR